MNSKKMIHEKTLEEIVTYVTIGSMLIPATYYAIPLAYSLIKDLAKLYFKNTRNSNISSAPEMRSISERDNQQNYTEKHRE
jgi:hypothetical protein